MDCPELFPLNILTDFTKYSLITFFVDVAKGLTMSGAQFDQSCLTIMSSRFEHPLLLTIMGTKLLLNYKKAQSVTLHTPVA